MTSLPRAAWLRRRTSALLAGLVSAALVLSGCSVYDAPLPGGANTGDNPMTVKVMFRDVLDLVPAVDGQGQRRHRRQGQEGRPQGLRRRGHRRDPRGRQAAGQRPRGDPADQPPRREVRPAQRATRPRHRQAGERRRDRPGPHRSQPRGRRGPRRALAAAQRRRRRPAQDDLLRAEQRLRGPRARGALGADPDPHLHGPAGRRTRRRSSPRIENTNRLALEIRSNDGAIKAALDDIPDALRSVDSQRADLVKLLEALTRLSGVGVRVIRASKESTINSLRHLGPVLEGFAKAGDNFAKSFQVFLTYPFIDEAVGRNPQVARNLHMGDYTNLSVNLDIDVATCSADLTGRDLRRAGRDARADSANVRGRAERQSTALPDSPPITDAEQQATAGGARRRAARGRPEARRQHVPSARRRRPRWTPAASWWTTSCDRLDILTPAPDRSCSTATSASSAARCGGGHRRRATAVAVTAASACRACRAPTSDSGYQEPQPIDPFGLAAHGLDAGLGTMLLQGVAEVR